MKALKILLAVLLALFFFIAVEGGNRSDTTIAETAAAPPNSVTAKIQKKVLLVFPYQPAMPHAILAGQALNEEFRAADNLNIELYVEYLDLNRFQGDEYQAQLLFEIKYKRKSINLVLLNGEAALTFLLKHRNAILPGVAAVFYDVISRRIEGFCLPPDIIGISL